MSVLFEMLMNFPQFFVGFPKSFGFVYRSLGVLLSFFEFSTESFDLSLHCPFIIISCPSAHPSVRSSMLRGVAWRATCIQ